MTMINRNAATAIFLLLAAASVDGFSTSTSFALKLPTKTTCTSLAASTVVEELVVTTTSAVAVVEEEASAAVVEPNSKSWSDDGFVFGLEGSGLDRPKGKVAQVVVEGDFLPSSTTQKAVVWSTLAGHGAVAAFSIMGMLHGNQGNLDLNAFASGDSMVIGVTVLQTLLVSVVSWLMADFGSGILHWSFDNYGNGGTPGMGGIIAAFQGHHSAPWTITEREFENNVSKLVLPFGVQVVLAMKLVFGLGPAATYFWTVFCVLEIMSQEMHKMSHMTKSEAGPVWNTLQDIGFTIDRKTHAQHHVAPYDGNYCILSGRCNKLLDGSGVFRMMEHVVYKINGIESNAWKLDPKLRERTLRGEYKLPKSLQRRRQPKKKSTSKQ